MLEQPIVCVIDDDDGVRDSIRIMLESYGYAVRTYASGIAFLRDAPPEGSGCLLIDVNMPGMTGLELLGELRSRGVTTPAILTTGGPTTKIPAWLDGAAASLMKKPFQAGELIGCIEAALNKYQA
jgi:two-component system response regulator FixJ